MAKFLIKQLDKYYSIKNNLFPLGLPSDNTQLESWYNKNGADDANIIFQNLTVKELPMTKDIVSGVWTTDMQLDMNKVTVNIELVDSDTIKSIKYGCDSYRIFDLLENDFDVRMAK